VTVAQAYRPPVDRWSLDDAAAADGRAVAGRRLAIADGAPLVDV
jgi:hypothetical protein